MTFWIGLTVRVASDSHSCVSEMGAGTRKAWKAFSSELKERPLSLAIVFTAAAAALLVSALTKKLRRRKREGMSVSTVSAAQDSLEMLANNLKAAANKVDNSAADVELALNGLKTA
jgi:hypothetical protein